LHQKSRFLVQFATALCLEQRTRWYRVSSVRSAQTSPLLRSASAQPARRLRSSALTRDLSVVKCIAITSSRTWSTRGRTCRRRGGLSAATCRTDRCAVVVPVEGARCDTERAGWSGRC